MDAYRLQVNYLFEIDDTTLIINILGTSAEENSMQNYQEKKQARQIHLFTRSLSLELAKHKHRLAAQLVSF